MRLTALLPFLCCLLLRAAFAQDLITPPTGPTLQGDIRVHDPVMIKHGKTYYVFHTGQGVPIKTSPDKIHWQKAGRVFQKSQLPAWHKADIPEQDGSLWAPDILYTNGKYYLYYSVSAWMNFKSGIGLATNTTLDSTNASYKWVDQGLVIDYKNGGEGVNVIDPNVFRDQDGKLWLFYGSYKAGLRAVELDPATGKLRTGSPKLITVTLSLGEGVFVIKGPAYYYIVASRGICCKGLESTYNVVIGRAKTVEGPYLNKEGKSWVDNQSSPLLKGDSTEPGRGHNGFFTEGDTTYIVYHAYTRSANGASLLNIKPLYADADGWPTLQPTGTLFKREEYTTDVVKSK